MIYTGTMNAALFIVFLTRLITGAAKKVLAHIAKLVLRAALVRCTI